MDVNFYMKKIVLSLFAFSALLLQLQPAAAQSSIITPKIAASPGVDPNADTFAKSAGCSGLSAGAPFAISSFIKALKVAGVWTKLHAVYPFYGGTESCHALNLKNPVDLDSAFRLTFNQAGRTHNSAGMTLASGTSANTYWVQSVEGFGSDISYGIWVATVSGTEVYMGAAGVAVDARNTINYNTAAGGTLCVSMAGNAACPTGHTPNGFISASNIAGTVTLFKNGSSIGTTSYSGNNVIYPMILHGYLNSQVFPTGIAQANTDITIKLAYIGRSLTTGEMTALFNAANTLQTALGR